MDIYNYAPNGEYLGPSKADPDPLNKGSWLIPANATTIAPGQAPGKTAVFDGARWALSEDHRGRSGWVDGKPATIEALGPLPVGWSETPPPIPLDQAQTAKQTEINAEKDRRIDAGVLFGGILYDSDDKAQIRVTGALMQLSLMASAGQTPPSVEWVAMDNSIHALNMSDLIGLGQAISGHLSACVLAANAHKAAIEALTDAKAVAAYDISKGWPS